MYGRKKAFDESVTDYKLSLVRGRERKKKIQADNGDFWHQQMDWKRDQKEQDYRDSQYDPDTMWNVEEPSRRRTLTNKKMNDQAVAHKTLTD